MGNLSRNLKEQMILDLAWRPIITRVARHYAKAHSIVGVPLQENIGRGVSVSEYFR
jgi:hypothetical protein